MDRQKLEFASGEERKNNARILSEHILQKLATDPDGIFISETNVGLISKLGCNEVVNKPVSNALFQDALKILKDKRLIRTAVEFPENLTDEKLLKVWIKRNIAEEIRNSINDSRISYGR